jgi:hypothetical protein
VEVSEASTLGALTDVWGRIRAEFRTLGLQVPIPAPRHRDRWPTLMEREPMRRAGLVLDGGMLGGIDRLSGALGAIDELEERELAFQRCIDIAKCADSKSYISASFAGARLP